MKKFIFSISALTLFSFLFPLTINNNFKFANATNVKAVGSDINDTSIHVSTFSELKEAIENSSSADDRIIFDNDIVYSQTDLQKVVVDEYTSFYAALVAPVDHTFYINGNGHTFSAENTGIDQYGYFNEECTSGYGIIVQGNLELDSITIQGGADSALFLDYDAQLKVINSTIERSGSTKSFEGGGGLLCYTGAKAYFKNSKISRNASIYGGGFFSYGAFLIFDGCSINENRSLNASGGGGAGEANSNSTVIMNNTTIANNISTEIGGAINLNNGSNLVLLNCSVVGNATTNYPMCGGGIGLNGTSLQSYNTVLANNYHLNLQGETGVIDDIGTYTWYETPGAVFPMEAYATKLNAIYTMGSRADSPYEGDINGVSRFSTTDNDFFKFIEVSPIVYDTYSERLSILDYSIKRPAIKLNELGTYSAYLKTGSSLTTGGCSTYLSVPDDMSTWTRENIVCGYKEGSEYKQILDFAVPSDETYKITTYQDGTTREDGVIGASGILDGEYCSLTVLPSNSNCKVSGGSIYGDLFPKGSKVYVEPILNVEGTSFEHWVNHTDEGSINDDPLAYYDYELTSDLVIQPIVTPSIKIINNSGPEWAEEYKGYITAPHYCCPDSTIQVTAYPADGYRVAFYMMNDPTYEVEGAFYSPDDEIYPLNVETVTLEALFWTGSYPEGKTIDFDNTEHDLVVPGTDGEISYGYSEELDEGEYYYSLTGEEDSYTTDIPKEKEAGTYQIYWKFVPVNDWIPTRNGVVTSSIVKAAPTIVEPTAINSTYTGNGLALINPGQSEHGTFLYSTDGSTYSSQIPTGINAGEYVINWKFIGDEYHGDLEGSVTATISKAKIAIPTEDSTEFTYNGNNQTYNIPENEAYTVTGNVAKDAGTHIVSVSLKDLNNYEWADGTTANKTYNFVIGKAVPTYTAPTAKSLTYNGEAQTLVNPGSTNDGTFVYSLTQEGEYTTTIPTGTNAGQYTIYWKLIGDNNHVDASSSVAVTIAKAKVTIPSEDKTEFKYNGNDQTYNIAPNDAYTVTGNVAKEVGTHVVTVSLNDPTNYEWADGTTANLTFNFVIAPAPSNVCITHWFLIGLLVVGLICSVIFYLLKNKLGGLISSSVFLIGTIITSIFSGCSICIAFIVIDLVIFVASLIYFALQCFYKKKEEDDDENNE